MRRCFVHWDMKKLLVADVIGIPSIAQESLPGTEITIVNSLSLAFESLKVKYNFDQKSWDEQHPRSPTSVQRPHIERAIKRREAEIQTRLPYWNAFFVYIRSNCGTDLCTSIGAATVALSFGSEYALINETSAATFSWHPSTGHWDRATGFYIGEDKHHLHVSRCYDTYPSLRRCLMGLVLEKAGYDSCYANNLIDRSKRVTQDAFAKAKELFDKLWPGLL